jgi:hypothetical protein
MSIVATILQQLELAFRLTAAVPALEPGTALAHAVAAYEARSEMVEPELLLAMAYIESRYDPTSLSRVEGDTRKTGPWRSNVPPKLMNREKSIFCGPLQTYARSWKQCLQQRELHVAYPTAVAELEVWLRDRRVRGRLSKALAGYGCGNHGVNTGKCNRYPERVLRMKEKIAVGGRREHGTKRALPGS